MSNELFFEQVKELEIELDNNKLNQLERYYELLVEWNKKINLTAITKKEDVYLKHFYDSLTLIKAIDLNSEINVCDIGTGAGFPGLVLKIVFPNLKITLVDALNKRINFLNKVIDELKLENIKTVHSRAEDFAKNNIELFDLVTCRAVAKLNILNEICIPMTKINGYFIPMKANIDKEIDNSKNSFNKLNAIIEDVISFKLPIENSERNLIKIKKCNKTNKIYPRNFGKISKNPL